MLTGQKCPWTKEGLLGVALAEGWVGQSRQYKLGIADEAMDSWALSAPVTPARKQSHLPTSRTSVPIIGSGMDADLQGSLILM